MPPVVPALWKDLGPCPGTTGVVTLSKIVNYPNPVTTQNTTLYYEIQGTSSSSTNGSVVNTVVESGANVSIKIITVAGRMIWSRALSGQDAVSGEHHLSWDCKDGMGVNLADGVYYYQVTLKAGGATKTKTTPMLILK
jgi:flagellar hook assembly protein FlgD